MHTLVIVDMQPAFAAANCGTTTNNILKLIEEAKTQSAPIVILEFANYGKTRKDINDAVKDYDKTKRMTKYEDDGSSEVVEALADVPKKAKVCGVNLGYCVLSTALGLVQKGAEVELVKEACNQPESFYTRWDSDSTETIYRRLRENGVKVV
jgi:nicotinamidase-related amidase